MTKFNQAKKKRWSSSNVIFLCKTYTHTQTLNVKWKKTNKNKISDHLNSRKWSKWNKKLVFYPNDQDHDDDHDDDDVHPWLNNRWSFIVLALYETKTHTLNWLHFNRFVLFRAYHTNNDIFIVKYMYHSHWWYSIEKNEKKTTKMNIARTSNKKMNEWMNKFLKWWWWKKN